VSRHKHSYFTNAYYGATLHHAMIFHLSGGYFLELCCLGSRKLPYLYRASSGARRRQSRKETLPSMDYIAYPLCGSSKYAHTHPVSQKERNLPHQCTHIGQVGQRRLTLFSCHLSGYYIHMYIPTSSFPTIRHIRE
jgi:hypothetical protein